MPCQSTLRGSPPFWRARAFGEPALFCLPTPVGADSGSPSIRSHTLCRSLPSLAPHSSFFSLGALTLSRSLSLLTLPLLYDFASRRVRFNPPFSMPVFSFLFFSRFSFGNFWISRILSMPLSKIFIRKRSVGWFLPTLLAERPADSCKRQFLATPGKKRTREETNTVVCKGVYIVLSGVVKAESPQSVQIRAIGKLTCAVIHMGSPSH